MVTNFIPGTTWLITLLSTSAWSTVTFTFYSIDWCLAPPCLAVLSAAKLDKGFPLGLGLLDCQATKISKVQLSLELGLGWFVRLQTYLTWEH